MGDQAKSLTAKLIDAAQDVESVQKRGKNTKQNYNYAQAEDIAKAATKALLANGLLCDFEFSRVEHLPIEAKSGGSGLITTVYGRLIVTDPETGATLSRPVIGTGSDFPGDKGTYKAMTGARKYALTHLLGIPIGHDPDDDAGTGQSRRQASAPKLDKAKAQAVMAAIEKRRKDGMKFPDLSMLMGSVGIDAPEKASIQSVEKRVQSLSDDEAAKLKAELEKADA